MYTWIRLPLPLPLTTTGGINVLDRELGGNDCNTFDSPWGAEYHVNVSSTLPIIPDSRSPMFVQLESFEAPMYSLHDDTVLMENPDSVTTQLDLFFLPCTVSTRPMGQNTAIHVDSLLRTMLNFLLNHPLYHHWLIFQICQMKLLVLLKLLRRILINGENTKYLG